jgi:NitT/TauT family transport system substrate-binding protein
VARSSVAFVLVCLIMLVNSCSPPAPERLRISMNSWLGYTPLLYASTQGWLAPLNVQLVQVVSLSESMYLFEAGNVDAFVGTQYEFAALASYDSTLLPVMLLNRSFGGDMIMSNSALDEILGADRITAYLEMDSVNSIVLEDFLRRHQLPGDRLVYHNADQAVISTLQAATLDVPALVVTYNPYNFPLLRQGFRQLASTQDGLDLLVIDALYTHEATLNRHRAQFVALKALIDDSIDVLMRDPQSYFAAISLYMPEVSYDEFYASLDTLLWLNRGIDHSLQLRLQQSDFPMHGLFD